MEVRRARHGSDTRRKGMDRATPHNGGLISGEDCAPSLTEKSGYIVAPVSLI